MVHLKAVPFDREKQAVYSETEQRVEVMQRQRDDERRQWGVLGDLGAEQGEWRVAEKRHQAVANLIYGLFYG